MFAPDLMLIGGIIVGLLSIPAIVGSLTSRQSPIYAFGIAFLGGLFVLAAYATNPAGYSVDELPEVVGRVAWFIFG